MRDVAIAEGTSITDQQNASLAKVAVLGPTAASDLFATGTDPVGQTITIKSLQFKVIGVTVAKGGSGFNNQDDMIYIPLYVRTAISCRQLLPLRARSEAATSSRYDPGAE